MKKLAALTCVVLLCINTKAQYSVPVSITKEYSIQVSNRVHARTHGMNLSKKQYQQIAKGINDSDKAINLLYKESLTPDCKSAVDSIRQAELNNFILIVGESTFRTHALRGVDLRYNHKEIKRLFNKDFIGIDSLTLLNYQRDYAAEQSLNSAKLKFDPVKRKEKKNEIKEELILTLKQYEISKSLSKLLEKKYDGLDISDDQLVQINKVYEKGLKDSLKNNDAFLYAAEKLNLLEQIEVYNQQKKREQRAIAMSQAVENYMMENNLPSSLESELQVLYANFHVKKDSTTNENSRKILRKEFKDKKRELLLQTISYSQLPDKLKSKALTGGLKKYGDKLKLSAEQVDNWNEYCFYLPKNNNNKNYVRIKDHKAKVREVLTDSQYEKLLKLQVAPRVKNKMKNLNSKLKENEITLPEEDKKLIKKYYTAQAMAKLRYEDDKEQLQSALKLLKQSMPKELKKQLALVNKPKKAAYRGTYQW